MVRCPSCREEMVAREAEGLYGRAMTIDICRSCEGIWFDGQELLQLAPAATLSLLADVVREEAGARPPLAPTLACPRCNARLSETHDRQRNTPFAYHRCPQGHGKFLTFFQFLRAKNVVRPLDENEIAELRKGIRQVNCVNCGAPVDIERGAVCAFCRTPLAILDPGQVQKAIDALHKAANRPAEALPLLPITLAYERLRAERATRGDAAVGQDVIDLRFDAADLIGTGLRALKALLQAR